MPRLLRPLALAAVLSTAAVGLAAAVAPAPGDAAHELPELDRAMNRAILAGDTGFLAGILARDYVLITSSGRVVDRDAFLAMVADESGAIEVSEPRDFAVRQRGDAAVLTDILHQRGVIDGKPFDAWLRYTDTWVWEDGGWKYLSGHASRMPEAEWRVLAGG